MRKNENSWTSRTSETIIPVQWRVGFFRIFWGQKAKNCRTNDYAETQVILCYLESISTQHNLSIPFCNIFAWVWSLMAAQTHVFTGLALASTPSSSFQSSSSKPATLCVATKLLRTSFLNGGGIIFSFLFAYRSSFCSFCFHFGWSEVSEKIELNRPMWIVYFDYVFFEFKSVCVMIIGHLGPWEKWVLSFIGHSIVLWGNY